MATIRIFSIPGGNRALSLASYLRCKWQSSLQRAMPPATPASERCEPVMRRPPHPCWNRRKGRRIRHWQRRSKTQLTMATALRAAHCCSWLRRNGQRLVSSQQLVMLAVRRCRCRCTTFPSMDVATAAKCYPLRAACIRCNELILARPMHSMHPLRRSDFEQAKSIRCDGERQVYRFSR